MNMNYQCLPTNLIEDISYCAVDQFRFSEVKDLRIDFAGFDYWPTSYPLNFLKYIQ